MATSTGTKVQQQLGDSGMIISVGGKGYVPLNLVVDLIDSLASGASFTKADADKVFTAYRERTEAERLAAMPKPQEISVPREAYAEPVETVPFYLYHSPMEADGTPIYPEMGYVVVHIPATVPEANRRAYAWEAYTAASQENRLQVNNPDASQPAGSITEAVEPVAPERAIQAAEERAQPAPKVEAVAAKSEATPKTETTSKSESK